MAIGDVAGAIGRGLVAGMVGTAAMTLSSTLEMKLRGREASSAPADAATKVLGIEPRTDDDKARFSNLVHWGYGTSWGAVRGVLGAFGLRPIGATAGHVAVVWGAELAVLPALEVVPPVRQWGAKELAVDALHHCVYAVATGLAYAQLTQRSTASS